MSLLDCSFPYTPYTYYGDDKNAYFVCNINKEDENNVERKDMNEEYDEVVNEAENDVVDDVPAQIKRRLKRIHVSFFSEAKLPTDLGIFRIRVYIAKELSDLYEYIYIYK